MNDNIQAFLDPKSVAVIGASDNPNKVGGRPIHYMKKFGFKGDIYPINPVRSEIQGFKAYPDIKAIGSVPDAVIFAIGSDQILETIKQCAELGVKAGVVMSSGFSELGEGGRVKEKALVDAAAKYGMRLIGPNSQGPSNFSNGAVLNFSTMFMETTALDGPIAIVSQSGIASVIPYHILRQSGFGVRYVVATGNDADVCACSMTLAVAQDPDIKLILVYLESISDPASLATASEIARKRNAYMVVLKSGDSLKGAVAAASHTGAIVGNDAAIDTFFARHGIWRASDINELVRATPMYLMDVNVGAGRLVAMSPSGAVAVMTADLAEKEGVELATLALDTKNALKTVLPKFGTPNNPLDTTAAILSDGSMWSRSLNALGSDPQADMVMVSMSVAGPGYDIDGLARDTQEFAKSKGKLVVLSAPQQRVREVFTQAGIPSYRTEAEGVAALAQFSRHQYLKNNLSPNKFEMEKVRVAGSGLLDEFASLSILSEFGIPVVQQKLCSSPEEAKNAFLELGGDKVVVKGCASSIPHKSEYGLVHLSLTSPEAVGAAASDCLSKLKSLKVSDPQIVVAKMVKASHEFALGVAVDPKLGPLVMISDGGTLIELRKDAVSLLAPFSVDDVKHACKKLRVGKLFDGYRDTPPLDLDAFAEAAVALGDFASKTENLVSVDINPIFAMPKGHGVLAVDAVVQLI